MVIKIKIKDLPDDEIKILDIIALPVNKLPKKYLAGYPHCIFTSKALHIHYDAQTHITLNVGDVMIRQLLGTHLELVYEAGDRLHRINNIANSKTTTFEI